MNQNDPRFKVLFEGVKWESTGNIPNPEDIPYATHSGVLHIFDCDLKCYRLSSGETVFDADDFKKMLLFLGMEFTDGPSTPFRVAPPPSS